MYVLARRKNGLMFGIANTAALTRLLAAMVFGVSSIDPATHIAAGALLVVAPLAALYLSAAGKPYGSDCRMWQK